MNEAEPSPNPPSLAKGVPGIAQSLALCALFFGITFVVGVTLRLLSRFTGVSLDMSSWFLVPQVIAWPVTIWIGLRWSKVPIRETLPLTPFPIRIVPALVIASVGADILLVAAAVLIPMPEAIKSMVKEAAESSKLTQFLGAVLMAPLAEELFFRGLVLRGYLGRYSTTKAVWASAVLFAAYHLNPWQAVVVLPLGLGFAWLFLRTGSLVPGILAHATVNFWSTFLLRPLALALGYDDKAFEALGHFPPSILAVGGTMAGIGGFVLWRQLTKSRRDRKIGSGFGDGD